MKTHKVILQGGGDHARVVLDCLLQQRAGVVGIFDPKYRGELFGVPQLGEYNPFFEPEAKCIVSIGDNRIRKQVVSKCRHSFTSVVHDSALISEQSQLGIGVMILHRSIIQLNCSIGNHVIVNTGAQIDHDCVVGDFVHLAPRAVLCGNVKIGDGAFIGAGAVVLPGKSVGKWSVVGAGAVVIDDIPDFCVAVGNPARKIKHIP